MNSLSNVSCEKMNTQSCASCKKMISVKAVSYGRNQCKRCRRANGTLVMRPKYCKFVYKNGSVCREELNHCMDYHCHCVNPSCNGAVYCELCMQCPVCDPCH
jgi:hypothetical protein